LPIQAIGSDCLNIGNVSLMVLNFLHHARRESDALTYPAAMLSSS